MSDAGNAARRAPRVQIETKAKAEQVSKLVEIRNALERAGFYTISEQAFALGVKRSTAWALLNGDKRSGPKPIILKQILASPNLPSEARRKVKEYIEAKIAGRYGHGKDTRRRTNDQFFAQRRGPLLDEATNFQQSI